MRVASLDCTYGISGDMLLAACLAAGATLPPIHAALQRAGLDYTLETREVRRGGEPAWQLLARAHGGPPAPVGNWGDFSATPLHHHAAGHRVHAAGLEIAGGPREEMLAKFHPAARRLEGEAGRGGLITPTEMIAATERSAQGAIGSAGLPVVAATRHNAAAERAHPHLPMAPGGRTHRPHRTLRQVLELVGRAQLPNGSLALARSAFEWLGEAEAKVHGDSVETVHFHEVGQDDAIIDILGVALAAAELGIDRWYCSPLNLGGGAIECAHGRFTVPAPATAELLRGLPTYRSEIEAELVTPTGAALVRALGCEFAAVAMTVVATGAGAGSYDLPGHADLLRIQLGEGL